MKEYIHNDVKLKEKDIDQEESLVKVLLTKDNSVCVTYNKRYYDFVGVKTEKGESFDDAIKRIFRDSFSISIPGDSIPSYSYSSKCFLKDYPNRNKNSIVNVYYYLIPLEDNTYNSSEDLEFIVEDIDSVIDKFTNNIPPMKLNRYIHSDELDILKEYKNKQ